MFYLIRMTTTITMILTVDVLNVERSSQSMIEQVKFIYYRLTSVYSSVPSKLPVIKGHHRLAYDGPTRKAVSGYTY
jgi:hypothetical protein